MSGWLSIVFLTAGPVLTFDGVVQLCIRNKTGPWKEGLATLLAGATIVVASVFVVWLRGMWFTWDLIFWSLIVGLVLAFNGLVQLCVRNKTGPWKEGGASLLAGAIIVGVSVFVMWLAGTVIWCWCVLIAGLVLEFNGLVQLCVRNKTGPWKEGLATLLAGAIILGVSVFVACLVGIKGLLSGPSGLLFIGFLVAGLVLEFNGLVQLCVRNKTGPWKEGGASLLAGATIVGVLVFMHRLAGILLGLWGL
jgi:hypothetical protein